MEWGKATGSSALDRIEIVATCTNILTRAGRPLTLSEIRQQISEVRGVGEFFMLQTNEKVARVAPDTWGLLDRDFHLSSEQRRRLLDGLADHLEESERGLHISEINSTLQGWMHLPDGVTPYMILSLSQTDSRLNVYKGQFVGLTAWGDSRRLTIADVLDRDVDDLRGPLSMNEIVQHVSGRVGRWLTGQDIVNTLRGKGFTFDAYQKMWSSPCEDTREDETELENACDFDTEECVSGAPSQCLGEKVAIEPSSRS